MFMDQERLVNISKLLQRLGDEDWTEWLKEEKQSIDSSIASDEIAIANREVSYDNLCKKILEYSKKNKN
jgi:hypothetical protein